MDEAGFIGLLILAIVIGGGIGYVIGNAKENSFPGFLLGFLLGPIG